MTKSVSWLLLGLCAIGAAGGYAQVANSPIFWCGRSEAFPATTVLALICLSQTALYLASAGASGWATPYRISQVAALPFLALGLFQVFQPQPGTVAFFALLAAIPIGISVGSARWRWAQPQLPTICAFFVMSSLGLLAALGQIPFSIPGVVVPRWLIWASALAAAAVSVLVVASIRGQLTPAAGRIPDLARYLPLTLLLFPVLRGKLPDIAYDSTLYKTTLPYQLAEWMTGDTAIIDQFMVGTNLQEIMNALLVVLTHDYLPAFISTISFVLLLFIMPLAFPVERQSSPAGRAVVAFAGVSAFVLSEAGIAQGTSHQEPLLLLFLVASLVPCPAWPAFLACAIAVKINAAFIAPLVLLHHCLEYRRSGCRQLRISPRRLLIGALGAAVVLLPQISRNVALSGRVLGMNEMLASVTDAPGQHQIMASGETRYDAKVRGGIVNNAILSACDMWLLAAICPTQYEGSDTAGFHVFPASRSPLLAVLFGAVVLVGACIFPSRRVVGLASVAVFAGCYIALLGFFSEARYFLPLSFGFSLLLLINRVQAEDVVRAIGTSRQAGYIAAGLGCWVIGGDLIPGTFTNVSWICKREILTAAHTLSLRQPETPVQEFLKSYVDRYKLSCPPPGLPPVILAEHDLLNSPYLGTQRIFYLATQKMISRFFAADPTRQARSAQAIIAVVAKDSGYAASVLGPAENDYTPCFHDGGMSVICSIRLAPTGTQCAKSLYPYQGG